jgi:predicted house-cleaning noncanonical NTP pyrophosphatase (MazG superfamily)
MMKSLRNRTNKKLTKANGSRGKTSGRPLHSVRPIVVITATGVRHHLPDEISPQAVGHKAFGLSALPETWNPPFFVIENSCVALSERTLSEKITEALAVAKINPSMRLMIRSSGTKETISHRGRLMSSECTVRDLIGTFRHLLTKLPDGVEDTVHWVVQQHALPKRKGKLSNERRLSCEKRDWVAEFEPEFDQPGFLQPIAIRNWRDGADLADMELSCGSELRISTRLKQIAKWAMRLSSRTLFEWLWDGRTVQVVQIDVAEPPAGVDPRRALQVTVQSRRMGPLHTFRVATAVDYDRYGKLRNAKKYEQLGYKMPPFYVLDDPKIIGQILRKRIPRGLKADLIELTKRSLIIRTDGTKVPGEQREMLPRSEELRSFPESRTWLLSSLVPQVKELKLEKSKLCLIAHHFIPSVASAWARAIPGQSIVLIESLWGIPEGLYWYSHDAFEIDTGGYQPSQNKRAQSRKKYKIWNHKLRYKGTFITPDQSGNWTRQQTRPPSDWNSSVGEKEWLFEIADTTRALAEKERHPLSAMWFIGNHPDACPHSVLPWFHSEAELTGNLKAAPRQKYKTATDFKLTTTDDWKRLQRDVVSGDKITRVIVDPIDADLIRNPLFARALARLAASKGFVVELSGGLLSHVFHILHSEGAQVECADPFGNREEVLEFDKIVRDKLPDQIKKGGERVEVVRLRNAAFEAALLRKLVEEALEAQDSRTTEELIGEIADVTEVLRGLCSVLKLDNDEIELARREKLKRRGGFRNGLMLIKTSTTDLPQHTNDLLQWGSLELPYQPPNELEISSASELPTKPLYRRPDFRQVDDQFEKLFTFETEVSSLATNLGHGVRSITNFSIPLADQEQNFTLLLELKRTGSSLRCVIRLRPGPLQLKMRF